ncbi:hypothetical protein [Pusillimonas sp.]|uniref:hypothetical protein n=1 Tax=Pusillimonas sp. TaxID=3040095 RepID=UPI0029A41FA4|nr:hypothetical protein [Pusillimonas sp.]MDX3893142.1 hypothetical protein [Pusillimonas sp.]
MATNAALPSLKSKAWILFDHIVDLAAPNGVHTNPWISDSNGQLCFKPDYSTLAKLLGVPLFFSAGTQSGVPALALDVWLSYELRRAGFGRDQVWPRPAHPRILPAPVAALLKSMPRAIKNAATDHVNNKASISEVTSSSASILGKNYLKQVDVIITDWATGPELLISTKRMDSSYGKNAPNRVEESYGDAKNLRLRHPLAALGFLLALRSDILEKEPSTAEWLFDLLIKLGREDDAYHATSVILMDYSDAVTIPDTGEEPHPEGLPEPGPEVLEEENDAPVSIRDSDIERDLKRLPKVAILTDRIPEELEPGLFLAAMVERVLDATPVNMHKEARQRRKNLD